MTNVTRPLAFHAPPMTTAQDIRREARDCVVCWLENAIDEHVTPDAVAEHVTPDAVRGWTMSADDFDSVAGALGLPPHLSAWEDADALALDAEWREALSEAAEMLADGASAWAVSESLTLDVE